MEFSISINTHFIILCTKVKTFDDTILFIYNANDPCTTAARELHPGYVGRLLKAGRVFFLTGKPPPLTIIWKSSSCCVPTWGIEPPLEVAEVGFFCRKLPCATGPTLAGRVGYSQGSFVLRQNVFRLTVIETLNVSVKYPGP